jgi:hypothetical protein
VLKSLGPPRSAGRALDPRGARSPGGCEAAHRRSAPACSARAACASSAAYRQGWPPGHCGSRECAAPKRGRARCAPRGRAWPRVGAKPMPAPPAKVAARPVKPRSSSPVPSIESSAVAYPPQTCTPTGLRSLTNFCTQNSGATPAPAAVTFACCISRPRSPRLRPAAAPRRQRPAAPRRPAGIFCGCPAPPDAPQPRQQVRPAWYQARRRSAGAAPRRPPGF